MPWRLWSTKEGHREIHLAKDRAQPPRGAQLSGDGTWAEVVDKNGMVLAVWVKVPDGRIERKRERVAEEQ